MCSKKRNDRGAVLVLAAVLILVLVGVAALAIDLGQLHIARARAQHVCDASALAGAWYLEPGQDDFNVGYVTETAQALARTNNESDNRKVLQTTGTDADEGVTVTDILGKSITLEGAVKVNFGFAALLGFDSSRVKASAKAMLDYNTGFAYTFLPLAVTDVFVLWGIPDPVSGNQKLSTPWWDMASGAQGTGNANLWPIVFPRSTYNLDYYRNLLTDSNEEVALAKGTRLDKITDDVAVATEQSLRTRVADDDWDWAMWNDAASEQKATSSRIVVLPIVHQDTTAHTIEIVGFAGFFIESVREFVDPNPAPHAPLRHRADLFGHFVPGIVGSKTVRWLKPFQPDQANLMYRVRLTRI